MAVTSAVRRYRAFAARRWGFTLVEVMVAASLLLLTVVCVTPLLVGSQRAASRESGAAEARRLAQSTLERLRSLPFGPPSPPSTATAAEQDVCVVAAVFPHADVGRNESDDFVVLADGGPWPAGTFVTRRRVGVYLVTTESRFAAAASSGFTVVSTARLAGYDSSTGADLPSGALAVTVQVFWAEHGDVRSVTRRDTLLDESCGRILAAAASSPR